MKKKIVVFTGAGISAESGVQTFRDSDGLWCEYDVKDVATIDGWRKDRQLVLKFYNERHKQLDTVQPNSAHYFLAELEKKYDVQIVTQNVDDLHERAGSTNVLHLHGELTKMRAFNNHTIYDWPKDFDIQTYSVYENDDTLRPHIVWFGEQVPNMDKAEKITKDADIFIVIGTSLQVYPAANLLYKVKFRTPIYYIDPTESEVGDDIINFTHIKEKATIGVKSLKL